MFGADDVVVLGVPVYYGRVPAVPGLLDGLQGEETPAVDVYKRQAQHNG